MSSFLPWRHPDDATFASKDDPYDDDMNDDDDEDDDDGSYDDDDDDDQYQGGHHSPDKAYSHRMELAAAAGAVGVGAAGGLRGLAGGGGGGTYDDMLAARATLHLSDPVIWSPSHSYRSGRYRYLDHQDGIVGTFSVRLVEARNLRRSRWSPLALGPVKILGLSTAHGEVGSYGTFRLGFGSKKRKRGKRRKRGGKCSGGGRVRGGGGGGAGGGTPSVASTPTGGSAADVSPLSLPLSSSLSLSSSSMHPSRASLRSQNLDERHSSVDDSNGTHESVRVESAGKNGQRHGHKYDYDHDHGYGYYDARRADGGRAAAAAATTTAYRTSTVHRCDNPQWSHVQNPRGNGDGGRRNVSIFSIPLRKGAAPSDGMRIYLDVRMDEEISAADSFVPGFIVGMGGGGHSNNSGDSVGMIGWGSLDVTSLCIGTKDDPAAAVADPFHSSGEGGGGEGNLASSTSDVVWDVWIELNPPNTFSSSRVASFSSFGAVASAAAFSSTSCASVVNRSGAVNASASSHPSSPSSSSSVGRVRIQVSYEPNGMTPRRGDIVALESFARQRPTRRSTCQPIIPPFGPLRVLDIKESHLLVEFDLPSSSDGGGGYYSGGGRRQRRRRGGKITGMVDGYRKRGDYVASKQNNKNQSTKASATTTKTAAAALAKKARTGQLRLHRNAVFVIERTTLVDQTLNTALKPADFVLSTPLGRDARRMAMPYVETAGDLIFPALLSGRLFWSAAKTSMAAGLTGLKAAGMAVLEEQNSNSVRRRRIERGRAFTD